MQNRTNGSGGKFGNFLFKTSMPISHSWEDVTKDVRRHSAKGYASVLNGCHVFFLMITLAGDCI